MSQKNASGSNAAFVWLWAAVGLWLLGHGLWRLLEGGSPMLNSVRITGGLLLLGHEFWKWRKSRSGEKAESKDTGEEEDQPLRSLVFFLDAPRDVEAGHWVDHLGQALGIPLNANGENSTEFVIPMPHPGLTPKGDDCFMLSIPEGVFWIFHVKSPYVEDLDGWAAGMRDARLREAVLGHQAWISVDLLTLKGGTFDRKKVYALIGKCLAALAGPDVRAVACPELRRCNEFDPAMIPVLSGGDPLSLFDAPSFAPVFQIGDDDEQMEAAVEEARRRWPEFVSLFLKRGQGSDRPFIVKAPFTSGDRTEFMWMEVTAIEGEVIQGTLANSPHHLEDFHQGQPVAVPLADLCDWVCAGEDDRPLGGWTQKVLLARPPSAA
jgi:uncharacterized protein YegJ (DUF2314 family)